MSGIDRRTFGRWLVGGGLGAVATKAVAQSAPEERLLVGSVSGLTVGQPVAFEYPAGHPAILLKVEKPAEQGSGAGADVVAFHLACPHMGCPIPTTDTESLAKGILGPCPCHESTFDMCSRGRQIYGRATQNLVRVVLEVEGDDIYATGVVGLPFGEALRSST